MATVTSPADATTVQASPIVKAMVNPRRESNVHPTVLNVSPGGSNAGGSPTVGQLFPVGNR